MSDDEYIQLKADPIPAEKTEPTLGCGLLPYCGQTYHSHKPPSALNCLRCMNAYITHHFHQIETALTLLLTSDAVASMNDADRKRFETAVKSLSKLKKVRVPDESQSQGKAS